ncbi:hypothetical protein AG0111_0g12771 [Alternaria gaisen]|uniref:Uncharacterized protein n=1 Tax=Alternaria gaisen TaxID=167740 RepID=A0ACB6F3F2_9PLEO|nr:hypothetical protein AG0111_0g12771 [Alternaria gaisen]
MPNISRFLVALNGTHPHTGNATVTPPSSYVQPIEDEVLWWKYTAGGIGLIAGVGAFVTSIYLCMAKRQERAAGQVSRTTPPAVLPFDASDAPGGPGGVYELEAIDNDPPPPYDTPDAVFQLQHGRYQQNEYEGETSGRLDSNVAELSDGPVDTPVDTGVTVARGYN